MDEELRKKAENIFTEYCKLELCNTDLWKNSKEEDFKRVDDDLYFWDGCDELDISEGNMGDGWICVWNDFFGDGTL